MSCDDQACVAFTEDGKILSFYAGVVIQQARQHPEEYAAIHKVAQSLLLQQPRNDSEFDDLPTVNGRSIVDDILRPFSGGRSDCMLLLA
jgi:ABC-type dipeptide/oligopeptide/nickel transport system ATPase component